MGEVRVRKIQEFIKQEVSAMLLREIKDPRVGFVTVTDAKITGDLREATVYVSLYGSPEENGQRYRYCGSRRDISGRLWASGWEFAMHRRLPLRKIHRWITA